MSMSHLGLVLPWQDIGPAWIYTVHQKGFALKDVTFLLGNASQHIDRPHGHRGTAFCSGISRALSRKAGPGGAVDWGLRAVHARPWKPAQGSHRQIDACTWR